MKVQIIKLKDLHPNVGQVEGLPKNPRFIKDDKFKKLVNSLREDPEMMQLREVIAYDNHGELVIICGNMRFRAAKELGLKEVPCKILPADTDVEKLKAYTIKDNAEFGQNDWDALANEWDTNLLSDWGIDVWKDIPSAFASVGQTSTAQTEGETAQPRYMEQDEEQVTATLEDDNDEGVTQKLSQNTEVTLDDIEDSVTLSFKLSIDENQFVMQRLQHIDANKENALLKALGYDRNDY